MEDINKLSDMLRHIHNDIEIVKRELFLTRYQISGIGYALHDISRGNEISDVQIDDITNPSIDAHTEADRGYSAIDEKDKREWEKIRNERFEFKEYEE